MEPAMCDVRATAFYLGMCRSLVPGRFKYLKGTNMKSFLLGTAALATLCLSLPALVPPIFPFA